MDVAILTQYYLAELIPKPHELARGLAERGHEVIVITAFPNYPTGRLYADTQMRPWQWDNVEGVRVLRLPLYPDHGRSAIRRVLNYGAFAVTGSQVAEDSQLPIAAGTVGI